METWKLRPGSFKAIKTGYPDEGMPGFDSAFTDDEIHKLIEYIKTGINNVKRYDFSNKITTNIFKTRSVTIRLDTIISGLKSPWESLFYQMMKYWLLIKLVKCTG